MALENARSAKEIAIRMGIVLKDLNVSSAMSPANQCQDAQLVALVM